MRAVATLARRAVGRPAVLARSYTRSVARLGGAGPPLQPFKRTKMPEATLFEEHELIWDDRVAAEMCLDFDASFVPTSEGFQWWLGGLGFFFGLLGLVSLTDPSQYNPVVNKAETMPDLGLSFIETGGSKAKAAEEGGEEEEEE